MRILLAFRAFFKTLLDRRWAADVQRLLNDAIDSDSTADVPSAAGTQSQQPVAPKPPVRSDAITLLETLQREARFVDIVKEPLGDYNDAQIGAAVRDVLRQCGEVLERLFDLQPVVGTEEGAEVEAPAGYDAGRFRLTGNVRGEPPFRGSLVHHGWEATRCELPQWHGSHQSALIVAPVELEVK